MNNTLIERVTQALITRSDTLCYEVVEALERLRQQGEPVAVVAMQCLHDLNGCTFKEKGVDLLDESLLIGTKLYTSPQPAQQQGEPVAWLVIEDCHHQYATINEVEANEAKAAGCIVTPLGPLASSQPAQPAELTDEEIATAYWSAYPDCPALSERAIRGIRAVIAADRMNRERHE